MEGRNDFSRYYLRYLRAVRNGEGRAGQLPPASTVGAFRLTRDLQLAKNSSPRQSALSATHQVKPSFEQHLSHILTRCWTITPKSECNQSSTRCNMRRLWPTRCFFTSRAIEPTEPSNSLSSTSLGICPPRSSPPCRCVRSVANFLYGRRGSTSYRRACHRHSRRTSPTRLTNDSVPVASCGVVA